MTNWRLLEAEIIDICRNENVEAENWLIEDTQTGDKILEAECQSMPAVVLNITAFAKALADRVTLNTQAVAAKSEPANLRDES